MKDSHTLINRIKAGERDAFREFVDAYKKNLYAIAFHLTGNHADADDLSQVVFIKFFKTINQYRQESGLQNWLYKIAVNSYIDKKRKKVNQIMMRFPENDNLENMKSAVAVSHSKTEQTTESVFIRKHVDKAIDGLSPKEKAAFILKHFEDRSIREIAAIIETSEGTVKSLLFRGVKKMQQALEFYRPELGLEDA